MQQLIHRIIEVGYIGKYSLQPQPFSSLRQGLGNRKPSGPSDVHHCRPQLSCLYLYNSILYIKDLEWVSILLLKLFTFSAFTTSLGKWFQILLTLLVVTVIRSLRHLSDDLENVVQWANTWLVCFNAPETKLVSFHHHQTDPGFRPVVMDASTLSESVLIDLLVSS